MKKCPYCAGDINDDAIVCKHCGRAIMDKDPSSNPMEGKSQNIEEKKGDSMGEMGADKTDYQTFWFIFLIFIYAPCWIGALCTIFPGFKEVSFLLSFPAFYLFVVNLIFGPIIIIVKLRKWKEYNIDKKRNALWILLFTMFLHLILFGVVILKSMYVF